MDADPPAQGVKIARRNTGATHFLMKTLPKVSAEMALHVLTDNMIKVMSVMGIRPSNPAMRELRDPKRRSSPRRPVRKSCC